MQNFGCICFKFLQRKSLPIVEQKILFQSQNLPIWIQDDITCMKPGQVVPQNASSQLAMASITLVYW